MDREEFIREVRRLNDTRVHKVTGSIGVYAAYKYIRKHKWYDIGRPLKEGEFYRIVRRINDYLAEELSRGNEINTLTSQIGSIRIKKETYQSRNYK